MNSSPPYSDIGIGATIPSSGISGVELLTFARTFIPGMLLSKGQAILLGIVFLIDVTILLKVCHVGAYHQGNFCWDCEAYIAIARS